MRTPYEKCPILRNSTALSLDSSFETCIKNETQFQDASVRKSISFLDEDRLRFAKFAIIVSVVSFMVSLSLSLAGLVCTIIRSSPSTAAFSADCFLDALSSIIVILKYWMSLRGQVLQEAKACIYLGVLFVTSALAVIIKATTDMAIQPEVEESDNIVGLIYLSVASAISFILLAGAKYWLYRKLYDDSLILDAINTLFSGVFAIAIGITAQVMLYSPHLWYLDAAESMIFAFLLGIYGVKVIAENVYRHRVDKEFENTDSESNCGRSSSGVHEKSKLIQVAVDKAYTTFPNNRNDA